MRVQRRDPRTTAAAAVLASRRRRDTFLTRSANRSRWRPYHPVQTGSAESTAEAPANAELLGRGHELSNPGQAFNNHQPGASDQTGVDHHVSNPSFDDAVVETILPGW